MATYVSRSQMDLYFSLSLSLDLVAMAQAGVHDDFVQEDAS